MTYLSRDIQLRATERRSIELNRRGEVTPENVKKEVEQHREEKETFAVRRTTRRP